MLCYSQGEVSTVRGVGVVRAIDIENPSAPIRYEQITRGKTCVVCIANVVQMVNLN